MCGRKYGLEELTWAEYHAALSVIPPAPATNFQPNYNIAPTHEVPVGFEDKEGARRLGLMRWGLVPHWAKDAKVGYKMINARAETLTEKPSFRPLLERGRCAILVSGFYEWQKLENPKNAPKSAATKQAYKIALGSGQPMIMAGLWTRNHALEMESYTVITTAASEEMAPYHHRMPVILDRDRVDQWFGGDWAEAVALLAPHPGPLAIAPVDNAVGNVRNNYPELLDPLVLPSAAIKG